jgi:uncharacterized coiled-coil protein SlyX
LSFLIFCGCFWLCRPAEAQDTSLDQRLKKISDQLKAQEKKLADQERALKAQQAAIAEQAAIVEAQRKQLVRLRTETAQPQQPKLLQIDATVPPPPAQVAQASPTPAPPPSQPSPPSRPVGEAPKEQQEPQVIQSLPQGLAVLTPAQHFILTPSIEYTQATANRLVYEGVVIVPGINVGEVTASTDDRSIFAAVADVRYGITDRLEAELRVPLIFSDDRATVLSQGPQGSATQSIYISGKGLGDINLGARYQINDGADDWPIFVANARTNLDTGIGPFNIKRNSAGIAESVALGSGFLGLQGGFSVLKVTDPAVLYGSVNYVYQLPKNINQTIGGVAVGEVDPSNSVNVTMGFGFAVNPDFSFSLGYAHSYVFPQVTYLGGTRQSTTSLEVGTLSFGMAYRVRQNMSLNANFQFGVTADAPNMYMIISLPTSY